MIFGSTFSGVGGLDLGLERAGMRVAWQCEADAWKRSVLASHWPEVRCFDDVTTLRASEDADAGRIGGRALVRTPHREHAAHDEREREQGATRVNLLCGGFPCQDLSVAGKRRGLAGARSGLFHEFARLADALRPSWLLLENVPGLFSSNDGRDLGVVLGTLADLGYGVAWRVLDARYFGVPQRRRRVFVVGHLGDDSRPALRALCESCDGSPQASRSSWQVAAARVGASASGRGDVSHALTTSQQRLDPNGETMVVSALDRAQGGVDDNSAAAGHLVSATLTGGGYSQTHRPGRSQSDDVNLVAFHQIQDPIHSADHSPALGRKSSGMGIAFAENSRAELVEAYVHQTLTRPGGKPGQNMAVTRVGSVVRRLTPVECERLMGWPDGWTAPEGVKAPDSRRYAACGDGVVANVSEWVGRRIVAIDALDRQAAR